MTHERVWIKLTISRHLLSLGGKCSSLFHFFIVFRHHLTGWRAHQLHQGHKMVWICLLRPLQEMDPLPLREEGKQPPPYLLLVLMTLIKTWASVSKLRLPLVRVTPVSYSLPCLYFEYWIVVEPRQLQLYLQVCILDVVTEHIHYLMHGCADVVICLLLFNVVGHNLSFAVNVLLWYCLAFPLLPNITSLIYCDHSISSHKPIRVVLI